MRMAIIQIRDLRMETEAIFSQRPATVIPMRQILCYSGTGPFIHRPASRRNVVVLAALACIDRWARVMLDRSHYALIAPSANLIHPGSRQAGIAGSAGNGSLSRKSGLQAVVWAVVPRTSGQRQHRARSPARRTRWASVEQG
ncbi:hypothetical protein HYPSUDRAFT_661074 [Hypholoma sublateritium FD-334 SS-4]|uniref:Uncharacterized protein n=1 Tax=Hypholoma sublateritium (strain FD-334 SS-4) TaxID=945553 RepID=A0A0D2NTR1_HYPSF|nr:hypothetical protein HYPSUDRAFT_661074 [Hypholoma sublateritium FD-334 SS-4]